MGMKLVYQAFSGLSSPPASTGDYAFDSDDANRPKVKLANGAVLALDSGDRKVNYARNSGFWFAQRQTPATLTTITQSATARNPGPDGWGATIANADVQYQRADTDGAKETGLQGRYYGTFKKITNTGKFAISQVLEAREYQQLRGRTVRFQCWLKASASKTLRMAVLELSSSGTTDTMPASFVSNLNGDAVNPSLGTNLSYVAPLSTGLDLATQPDSSALSCAVTTAWQRFGGAFTLSTNFKNLVLVVWTDSGFAANDTFSISQVSLTDGYDIQDWCPKEFAFELLRVQRYFAKTCAVDSLLGSTALGVNTGEVKGIVGKAAAANGDMLFWTYPTEMIISPTVTAFNPATNSNAHVRQITQGADATAGATITAGNTRGCKVIETSPASSAVGDEIGIHLTADAKGTNNEFA